MRPFCNKAGRQDCLGSTACIVQGQRGQRRGPRQLWSGVQPTAWQTTGQPAASSPQMLASSAPAEAPSGGAVRSTPALLPQEPLQRGRWGCWWLTKAGHSCLGGLQGLASCVCPRLAATNGRTLAHIACQCSEGRTLVVCLSPGRGWPQMHAACVHTQSKRCRPRHDCQP